MRRLLAVLGQDVSASLSPRLHAAAAHALGLDIAYVPVSCPSPEAFRAAVAALRTLDALGSNVTIPYKREAYALSSERSPVAEALGAVNTLSFVDGVVRGDNTDGPGLLRVLSRLPAGCFERVQVLGSGGASMAAAWAAARVSADVRVSARSISAAMSRLPGVEPGPLAPVADATLVISGLPGEPSLAEQILTGWIDHARSPRVLDLAYAAEDAETPLVEAARRRGLPASDGREMLVEQAALSLSGWTGADVEQIRAAMCDAVGIPSAGLRFP